MTLTYLPDWGSVTLGAYRGNGRAGPGGRSCHGSPSPWPAQPDPTEPRVVLMTRPPRARSTRSSEAPSSHARNSPSRNKQRREPGGFLWGISPSRVRSCTVRVEQPSMAATSSTSRNVLVLTRTPVGLRIPRRTRTPHGCTNHAGVRTARVQISAANVSRGREGKRAICRHGPGGSPKYPRGFLGASSRLPCCQRACCASFCRS
jgi:hypothetical protein